MIYDEVNSIADYRVIICSRQLTETFKIAICYNNVDCSVTIDGVEQPDNTIPLIDDRKEHSVEVRIPVAGG